MVKAPARRPTSTAEMILSGRTTSLLPHDASLKLSSSNFILPDWWILFAVGKECTPQVLKEFSSDGSDKTSQGSAQVPKGEEEARIRCLGRRLTVENGIVKYSAKRAYLTKDFRVPAECGVLRHSVNVRP